MTCPDRGAAPFHLLYPGSAAAEGADPLPIALLFPSGSFDFVYAPDPGDPLAGTHYAEPSRLTEDWSRERAFTTLGMLPADPDTPPVEIHDGSLAAALAFDGVAVLIPPSCWGDLWADAVGERSNDFAEDFFVREGYTAARWSWALAADPAFGEAFDAPLPIAVDPDEVYAIGLGEGGRGVAELLSTDLDADGIPDLPLAGALLDSPPDDLRLYFADAGLYASTVEGLSRVFPSGPDATATGSLWAAPLPARIGLVASTRDPVLLEGMLDAALERLGSAEGGWVHLVDEPVHVLLDGGADDADLASIAVGWLRTGTAPAR
jgi:hypothetical protein